MSKNCYKNYETNNNEGNSLFLILKISAILPNSLRYLNLKLPIRLDFIKFF